jgi:N-formylglutamate deformylase
MSEPFVIVPPRGTPRPIVVSCPHSGTEIPADIARGMRPEMVRAVPDTDWFVHELYDFAPAMGITLLHARYSRFVIDLNRDPEDKPLYTDGRHQTGLVPTTSFDAKPIYAQGEPNAAEIKRRLETYYRPYHAQAERLVLDLKGRFKHVLFYEAHSIKRLVTTIRPTPFPDLMLGDQKGKTAAAALSDVALQGLRKGGRYQVAHNEPFMGGYLTRKFGRPHERVHALQLEMAQDVYMNETSAQRDKSKQAAMAEHLSTLMQSLATALETLA